MSTQRKAAADKKALQAVQNASHPSGTVTSLVDATHCMVSYLGKEARFVNRGLAVAEGDMVRLRIKGGDFLVTAVVSEMAGTDVGTFSGGSAASMVGGWEKTATGVLVQWCSVTITPINANTWTATVWTFPIPFATTPRVVVGNASASAALTRWGARNQTATQTDIGLERTNTNGTVLDVIARGWWRIPA